MHEYKRGVSPESCSSECFLGVEITRPQGRGMPFQELIPDRLCSIRCGLDAVLIQDRAHRCPRDRHDPKFAQLSEYSGVSPAGSLGHFENELLQIPLGWWASCFPFGFPFLAPIRSEPSLKCAILNNRDDFTQNWTDSYPKPDEFPALVMGERNPLGEFPSENPILNCEVLELGDQLIVV
jgi:hypothetical protein